MERFHTLAIAGALILILYITVLGFIFADLWSGVRKAKKAGIMRTSEAYKRTIDKIAKYYNMMIALTLVDASQISLIFFMYYCYGYDIPMIPIFSAIGAAYVAWVEVHSIMEPADIKEQKQQKDFLNAIQALVTKTANPEVSSAVQIILNAANEKDEELRKKNT